MYDLLTVYYYQWYMHQLWYMFTYIHTLAMFKKTDGAGGPIVPPPPVQTLYLASLVPAGWPFLHALAHSADLHSYWTVGFTVG